MAARENINPQILRWARESAGLSILEAAQRLHLASEAESAATKLASLEAGDRLPTREQLTRIAALYRRPLVTFYMDAPPVKGERGEDFRTFHRSVSERENALLDALIRDIRARQSMVRSILEDEEEAFPLPFVGSISVHDGVNAAAKAITQALDFPSFSNGRSGGTDELFRNLRARTEKLGVFVLLAGDLGSYHSALSEEVFRGFVIADKIAPFIVINDQDAKSARSFTLVHELTHVFLGQSGISGTPELVTAITPTSQIEQFCNDVASEVLLPSSALTARPSTLYHDKVSAQGAVENIAARWSVSEPMVAYRLYRLGWISTAMYRALHSDYENRWRERKLKDQTKAKEIESGPSYYTIKQHRLGNALMDVVRRTLRDNLLTHTKAAKVLGVKASSVEPLIRRFETSGGAYLPEARR